MGNPFTLSFGKKPLEEIARPVQTSEIVEAFTAEPINQQIYIITGVRGSGKTVLLTDISNRLRNEDDWIVVELNPASDLLQGLATKLARNEVCADIFKKAKITLSFLGVGVELGESASVADLETTVGRMLESLKKREKRVLVAIDEVTNTESMRIFVSAFQIFIRQELPVFLLMTGLYENIEDLQNEKSLTFLYRAPKIMLPSLNLNAIASRYRSLFHLERGEAAEMAGMTKGYPFAFQALGYLTWQSGESFRTVLPTYRQYLEDFVYDKIWSELSAKDRELAKGVALAETGEIREVMEKAGFSQQEFSPYRKRLIRKGIVDTSERGKLTFSLPLFDAYVQEQFF
ncbi:MAG: ATP-binding protein [Oscillospiraceae bacterium]|nr:ATP-binding protein [Oscillospiraceae bacterium]